MEQVTPQPFNRSRLKTGLHLNSTEREVLQRIKVLRTAPRLLRRLHALNPNAEEAIPDFAGHAMDAYREILTALAEERSWDCAIYSIDRAVIGLNHLADRKDLRGTGACARLAVRLRKQRGPLQRLDWVP
ncbi:hypothetical protein NBRC116588_32780 [Pyruvatibacter sp. HU-CL02332]|uniref:hypothetical protein n=1 Tax=Pyruvatibacter sp. HU-CL02332 TaxID=3127650 RepID=UPI00310B9F9D